ncbi:FCD domain-containing protein [Sedimentitalea sp.]|uniref:FadR/GntR family transcriptional regulator n=1 Tax=Sedimentitalea sp. TaxID=2048915 RepID=UPI003298C096
MQTDIAKQARDRILGLLDTGELGETGRLPSERALSEQFRIGRRQVRRALAQLETEGLIWRKRGAGTFAGQATDPTAELAARIAGETNAIQMMEARLCIEPELAALCASRIRPEEIAQLRAIAERLMVDLGDADNEIWDSALHRVIAQSARNKPLLVSYTMLDEIRLDADWLTIRARARSSETIDRSRRQHATIIDTIAAADPDAARAAMKDHLNSHFTALRKAGTAS